MLKENIIIKSVEYYPRIPSLFKRVLDVKVSYEYEGETKNIDFINEGFTMMLSNEEIKDKIIEVINS